MPFGRMPIPPGSRFELFGMANNKFEGFLCKALEFGKGADLFTFAQAAPCIRTKITEVPFIELNNALERFFLIANRFFRR